MNTRDKSKSNLPLIAICTLLTAASLLAFAAPALADLPPRPTLESPTKTARTAGARIELQAHFPTGWPWATSPWQDTWTAVQWQDPHSGTWNDVEGWQGELDAITTTDSTAVGRKRWWVAQEDLGSGPFRWQVYVDPGGRLLGTSRPFDLPSANGATVTVEVSLE